MNEDAWEKIDCNKALQAVVETFLFDNIDSKNFLHEFIMNVELIKRSQVKQVPALFKKDVNERD